MLEKKSELSVGAVQRTNAGQENRDGWTGCCWKDNGALQAEVERAAHDHSYDRPSRVKLLLNLHGDLLGGPGFNVETVEFRSACDVLLHRVAAV